MAQGRAFAPEVGEDASGIDILTVVARHGAHLIVAQACHVVEAVQPIGQPPAAGLQEGDAQAGVTFEHAALDQREQRHHLLHRVRARVQGEAALKSIGARGG